MTKLAVALVMASSISASAFAGDCPARVIRFTLRCNKKSFTMGVSPGRTSSWREDGWEGPLNLDLEHDPESCSDRLTVSVPRWYGDKVLKTMVVDVGHALILHPGEDFDAAYFGNDTHAITVEAAK